VRLVTDSTLAELEFLFMKRGEPECEWITSDTRRDPVEAGTGELALGEPEGVAMEVMDASGNRGGSRGSSSTIGFGSGSGRISASTEGNS